MHFAYKTHYYVSAAHIYHAGTEKEKSKLESQSLSTTATKELCLEKNVSVVINEIVLGWG